MMPGQEQLPLTVAQLAGNFCETLFFGIYLGTCWFVVPTLLLTNNGNEERWVRLHEIRWMMIIVALLFAFICTFNVAIGLLHNIHAFVEAQDSTAEFFNITDWINIARSVNQILAMVLGDFVLVYRCWIVHGRRWLVIMPSLVLYLVCIAIALKLLEVEVDLSIGKLPILGVTQASAPLWETLFVGVFVQNVLTTGLLIWRIWRVERQSALCTEWERPADRPLRKVIRVVAESGAAYILIAFVTCVIEFNGSNALYFVSDMMIQTTGIVFNAVIIRSSTRRDQQFTVFNASEMASQAGGATDKNSQNIELSAGVNDDLDC